MKRKRMLALVMACCMLFGQSAWGGIAEASEKTGIEQEEETLELSQENVKADIYAKGDGISGAKSVREITRDVQTVCVGDNHSGAIMEDGSLYMWGENGYGQIGNGTTTDQLTPVKILSDVVSLSLINDRSGAITKDGSLYMWGENDYGEIGNGTTTDQITPVKVLSDVVSVSFGSRHNGAITKDGSLYMWGMNNHGQIGNGTTTDQVTPVKVLSDVVSVSLGVYHTGAITADGSLYMWGCDKHGKIGYERTSYRETCDETTPVKVLSEVVSLSLGSNYSGAITEDGSLYMWGLNSSKQISEEAAWEQATPFKVLSNVVSVQLDDLHSGAITKDGSLYMWGYNGSGEIGNGTTTGTETVQATPVKVLSNVVSVQLEQLQSGAITADGSLYIWGLNSSGQIGNDTKMPQFTPAKVLSDVVSVSLGRHHRGAITKDGSLYMWGQNDGGKIGNGTTADQFTPVKIQFPESSTEEKIDPQIGDLVDRVFEYNDGSVCYSAEFREENGYVVMHMGTFSSDGTGTGGVGFHIQLEEGKELYENVDATVAGGAFTEKNNSVQLQIHDDSVHITWKDIKGNIIVASEFLEINKEQQKWGICGDNLTWRLDENGVLTITGEGDMESWESWDYGGNADNYSPWTADKKIYSVVIKDGVTSIGSLAFLGCSNLESIEIPNSVKTIGDYSFKLCEGLEEINLRSITSIGRNAFQGCEALTSIEIPSGITEIKEETFRRCVGLTDVTIPDSVTTIANSAFVECNGLKDVYYSGTETQWRKINIEDNNSDLKNAAIHCMGKEVFNATIYHANVVLNSLSNLSFIYPDTPCEKLSRQAEYTGLSSSAQAWKAMKDVTDAIDDPTNIMNNGLSEKDFYEGIIFSIFEETTSFHNDELAAVEDAISSMDDFMSYITTNMKAVYDIELYEDNQVSTLTDKQVEKLQEISEAYFDSNGIVKTANVMSKLVEVIKYVKDIGEYCEYVCNSAKLLHMNESYKAVLQDMYEVCPSENVNLRLALKECISIMEASEEEFAMKMGTYGVAIAGKNIIKTGLSKMWKTALNKVRLQNPCAASIWAGYKSGIYISDTLLNTSNIAEKTLQMHMMYDVKKILTEVYGKGVGEFDHERSEALAEKFLAVVDVCFKYKDADCDCAYGFVETVDDAVASKIREIFGCDSNDTLKKQIKSIQKDSLAFYKVLCTKWIIMMKSDYPEEYEKYKDLLGNDNTVRICKSYEIACPVNVYVYDENNKLVASVIGNKVYCGDDSEMTVMCVDTHKTIYFYDSAKKYSIRYVGTDTGKMDITVNEYGTEGEKLRTVKHIDVPLTKGKTYSSEENVEATDELSYQLVEDGNENVLEPTADTANTNLKKYTLSVTGGYLCNEDGNMSFSGEYYAGEKVTVCANVPENYIWQGWTTSNPQNVISNPSERNITIIMPANSLELVGNSKKKSEQQVIIPSTPDKNVTDVPGSTSNKSLPKVGTRFAVHDDIDDGIYMVTKEGATLAFVGPVKKSVFVRIASRLMINGVSYRVESIGKNAFKGNKKIRAITIPKTVRTIGKGAFYKCKNLSKVIIEGNALSTVKARAFKGTSKKMKVIFKSSKVTPKKRLTLFKKMKKSGMSKSAKLVKYGR